MRKEAVKERQVRDFRYKIPELGICARVALGRSPLPRGARFGYIVEKVVPRVGYEAKKECK
ncbi:hypothetical protein AYR62_00320 [Secundilactobacillus paracollinoides]|uniref:Uncharacterized protein n=1 Tax=Secundilactobacillus paracollinoides TaxID=240427 RepID=A0A1B2IVT1_9LACO|nr:hypothetical protein AYR61_02435 [Secundilactobacillus paracollinoides]ANZ62694.1 hypothetical protein AYR62_00320 [Secundilactobacillus paracollinoides]ANZ66150.1 hypothetical protein AYR63_02635 [Secundilactobacillus paracollinoides]